MVTISKSCSSLCEEAEEGERPPFSGPEKETVRSAVVPLMADRGSCGQAVMNNNIIILRHANMKQPVKYLSINIPMNLF